ncbi:hypothetical protein HFP66_01275 [Bacillus sp. A17A.1]
MFKKLVVGALAAGIVLTGGIGAASHRHQPKKSSHPMPIKLRFCSIPKNENFLALQLVIWEIQLFFPFWGVYFS